MSNNLQNLIEAAKAARDELEVYQAGNSDDEDTNAVLIKLNTALNNIYTEDDVTDTTKRYKIGSCHEVGIAWTVDAPEELTAEELESFMEQLCGFSDNPDCETIKDFCIEELEGCIAMYECMSTDRIHLYMKIKAYPAVVQREMWTQDFQEVKT